MSHELTLIGIGKAGPEDIVTRLGDGRARSGRRDHGDLILNGLLGDRNGRNRGDVTNQGDHAIFDQPVIGQSCFRRISPLIIGDILDLFSQNAASPVDFIDRQLGAIIGGDAVLGNAAC